MSDPLIDNLPPDPRSALLGLIGSTFAELKNIDKQLITKSNNIAGIKTDLNRLVAEANSLSAPVPVPVVAQQVPAPQVHIAPALEPQPVISTTPVQPQVIEEDDGQLLLDFYRKIKPEDLYSRLADIDIKLNQIIMLLNGSQDKR
jgi:hypothetical protein